MDETPVVGSGAPSEPLPPLPGAVEPPPTPVVVAVTPPSASLGDRLVAQLVDALVGGGLFFFMGMMLAPQLGGQTPDGFHLEGVPAAILLLVVGLGSFLYFVLLELAFGATLGKLVAGARVRSVSGGRLSFRAALIRNAMRLIDGIGFYLLGGIVALIDKRHRRLGDLAAGTVVLARNWPRALRAFALVLALAAAAGGVVAGFIFRPPSDPPIPRYASIVLTDDRTVTVNKELFSPSTPAFFILFTLADVPAETALKVVWTAERVQGEREELKIDEASLVAGGQRSSGDFTLTRSSFSWPVGVYRADLYIGARLAQTIRFRVESPSPTGAPAASSPPSSGLPPPSSPAPAGSPTPR